MMAWHGARVDKNVSCRPAAPPRGVALKTSYDGHRVAPMCAHVIRRYPLSRVVLRRRSPLVAFWSLYSDTGHMREAVDAEQRESVRVSAQVAVGVVGPPALRIMCTE